MFLDDFIQYYVQGGQKLAFFVRLNFIKY